jgi:hypothetical protein
MLPEEVVVILAEMLPDGELIATRDLASPFSIVAEFVKVTFIFPVEAPQGNSTSVGLDKFYISPILFIVCVTIVLQPVTVFVLRQVNV